MSREHRSPFEQERRNWLAKRKREQRASIREIRARKAAEPKLPPKSRFRSFTVISRKQRQEMEPGFQPPPSVSGYGERSRKSAGD